MNVLLSMSVFRRVAETGSFSEVASELSLSQPTVSKHVAALEKHLNVKLLSRSTRQLNLTDAGKQYYNQSIHLLDELNEIESSIRNQLSLPSGTLRINTPVTFGELNIAPYVWTFLDTYPDLNIELIMDDHYVDLIKGGVDMAVRIGPLTDSNLIAQKIGLSPRVVVASPEYLAANGEPETLFELKDHQCIIYTLLTTRNEWHFTGPKGKETVRVNGRFSVNNPRIVREAVLASQGIAVTPTWLIGDAIDKGKAKIILDNFTPTPLDIHVVYPDRHFVPAKVRYFINFLRERFEKQY